MTNFDTWSWSNQVGEWQTYIYGTKFNNATASHYLDLSSSYKNPADTVATKGVRVMIDGTSFWNGQTMERTEMIPNLASSNYQSGILYYKWSMKQGTNFALNSSYEHQLVFFESHFCEVKYGGSGGDALQFFANGNKVWDTPFTKETWFNFAMEVDYSAKKVGFFASQGNQNVQRVYGPTSVSSVSTSDFHVGILRLPFNNFQGTTAEFVYYSGIQIVTTPEEANPGSGTAASSAQLTSNGVATSNRQATSKGVATSASNPTNPTPSTGGNCDDRTYCVNVCGQGKVSSCNCVSNSLVAVCTDSSDKLTIAPVVALFLVILLFI